MPHHDESAASSPKQSNRPPAESILKAAALLARSHFEVDPGIKAIYRLDSYEPSDRRIKLLEVNERTIPSGIVPVGFPPHPASGLHFQSVIIEVTPGEYERIRRRELKLPGGWAIAHRYRRPIPARS